MSDANQTFQLLLRDDIALVSINVAKEKVNLLKAEFIEQLEQHLKEIEQQPTIKGLIFYSKKKKSFIAGADINMLEKCETQQQAKTLSQVGQKLFNRLENFHLPIVAAVQGTCLGGGLEFLLACHARIAADTKDTLFGLPEVQLGLLPGSGGTQRLPRLIGLRHALDMMLTGRKLNTRQALHLGLIDQVVPDTILIDAALELILSGNVINNRLSIANQLTTAPVIRELIFTSAKNRVYAKTKGNYPAPLEIIKVVKIGLKQGFKKGLAAEADAFGRLVASEESKVLRRLFFSSVVIKSRYKEYEGASQLQQISVLGAGLMGSGIAFVSVYHAMLKVKIKDINKANILKLFKHSWNILSKRVRSKSLTEWGRQQTMTRLSVDTDGKGLQQADIIIEAVFEDLELKQNILREVEQQCNKTTIFASNTSSLPITQIAKAAQYPARVVGLHYFSPVEKMPLVEVIPHATTDSQTLKSVINLVMKQNKYPIIVADKAGFYINRILVPYINEALYCLKQGEAVDKIDHALTQFGFPMGPIMLLDEVGIDIGTKIIPTLVSSYGTRFEPAFPLKNLEKDQRQGRKNGRGFYQYDSQDSNESLQRTVDLSIYYLLEIKLRSRINPQQIAERCVLMMLNEAARCWEEHIIEQLDEADFASIIGIGFPAFLGGPFRYMDKYGVEKIVDRLLFYSKQEGERFLPCALLVSMANKKTLFYSSQ